MTSHEPTRGRVRYQDRKLAANTASSEAESTRRDCSAAYSLGSSETGDVGGDPAPTSPLALIGAWRVARAKVRRLRASRCELERREAGEVLERMRELEIALAVRGVHRPTSTRH